MKTKTKFKPGDKVRLSTDLLCGVTVWAVKGQQAIIDFDWSFHGLLCYYIILDDGRITDVDHWEIE